MTATLLNNRLANSELYWEVVYDLTLSPCPSDMFTATMLYAARFATTQSKASDVGNGRRGIAAVRKHLERDDVTTGRHAGICRICDPMMLATFDPWPLVSDALIVGAGKVVGEHDPVVDAVAVCIGSEKGMVQIDPGSMTTTVWLRPSIPEKRVSARN